MAVWVFAWRRSLYYIAVEDVDRLYTRAKGAGAKIEEAPEELINLFSLPIRFGIKASGLKQDGLRLSVAVE